MTKALQVTKSNHIIEASYRLSLQEQRLILACLAKVDSRKEIPKTISLSAIEFSEFVGVDLANAHRELYKAADNLFTASIRIKDQEKIEEFHWIQSKAQYVKGEGRVMLTWSDNVLKYISQLRNRFTTYKLQHVTQLQSAYAIRLYELLMQFNSTKERTICLNDLRVILKLEGKYPLFRDLNKRVIKSAVAELNQRSDLVITYETIKQNRKAVKLRFDFKQAER
jgi:plasmid replication initiation protein